MCLQSYILKLLWLCIVKIVVCKRTFPQIDPPPGGCSSHNPKKTEVIFKIKLNRIHIWHFVILILGLNRVKSHFEVFQTYKGQKLECTFEQIKLWHISSIVGAFLWSALILELGHWGWEFMGWSILARFADIWQFSSCICLLVRYCVCVVHVVLGRLWILKWHGVLHYKNGLFL